jgi:hypothetical protein
MKKTIAIFAATLFLAACNTTTTETASTTDSTSVQVDTVKIQADSTSVNCALVDSTLVDSAETK